MDLGAKLSDFGDQGNLKAKLLSRANFDLTKFEYKHPKAPGTLKDRAPAVTRFQVWGVPGRGNLVFFEVWELAAAENLVFSRFWAPGPPRAPNWGPRAPWGPNLGPWARAPGPGPGALVPGPGPWALVPVVPRCPRGPWGPWGPRGLGLGSDTTNLESETTIPEQNSAPEPSGWVPESKSMIICTKIDEN